MAELYTTYTHTAQTLDADCPGKGVTSGEVTLQLRQILKAVPAPGPQVLPKGVLDSTSPYLFHICCKPIRLTLLLFPFYT